MRVSELFPDARRIRTLLDDHASAYRGQGDRDRDLGRALELICTNLNAVGSSASWWSNMEVRLPLSQRFSEQVRLMTVGGAAGGDEDLFERIGVALDAQGWPRPPSAVEQLQRFRQNVYELSSLHRPSSPLPVRREAEEIAVRACRVSSIYQEEFERRTLTRGRKSKYRKVATRSSAFLLVTLAYVGGVNDVPDAYDKISEAGKALYEYVLGGELAQGAESLRLAERELQLDFEAGPPRFRSGELWQDEPQSREPDEREPEA